MTEAELAEIEAGVRREMLAKAQAQLGPGALVGYNPQYPDKPYFVGKKKQGDFVMFGAGPTWTAAFEALRPVRDLGNGRFAPL